jgi:hypothetical protein
MPFLTSVLIDKPEILRQYFISKYKHGKQPDENLLICIKTQPTCLETVLLIESM